MRKIKYYGAFLDKNRLFEDKDEEFRQAFAQARNLGAKTFVYNGQPYSTDPNKIEIQNISTGSTQSTDKNLDITKQSQKSTKTPSTTSSVYYYDDRKKDRVEDLKFGRYLYLKSIENGNIKSRTTSDGTVLIVILNSGMNNDTQNVIIDFLESSGYEVSLLPSDYESGDIVVFRKKQEDQKDIQPEDEIIMPQAQTETDQKKLEQNGKKIWNDSSRSRKLVTRSTNFGKILVMKGQLDDAEKLELSAYAKLQNWEITTTKSDYKPGDILVFRKSENIQKEEEAELEKPSSQNESDKKYSIEQGKNLYKKLVQDKRLVSRNFSYGEVWVYLGQYSRLDANSEENLVNFLETLGWVKSSKEADKKDPKEIVFKKKEDLDKKEGDKPSQENTETKVENSSNPNMNIIPPPNQNRVEKIEELPNNLVSQNKDIPREERCKRLFVDLDDRDRRRGEKTGSNQELEECKYCLQQYNWMSRSKERIKQRYGLKGSGGSRAL
jgi:hypothetical protein